MPAFLSILQTILALIAGILIVLAITFGSAPAAHAPAEGVPQQIVATTTAPIATTTLAVATTTPPAPKPAAPAPAKPVETKPIVAPPAPKVDLPLPDVITTITNLAPTTAPSVNDRVRAALVNILCSTANAGPFESTSASGVVIDPRGVILTNAHVAQFYLLKDYPSQNFVQCVIRTGSPASPKYIAELLFISPSWITKNAEKLDDDTPTGNGEHDYALLRITGTVSGSVEMPTSFPFVLTSISPPPEKADILVAGYAAGFLGGISVIKDLYASSAFSRVGEVYTYGGNTIDLFSTGGTVVAQQGASGGAVTLLDGTLVGLIVTSTQAEQTGARDLRALATSYIIQDFQAERSKSLQSVLSSDLAQEAATFNQLYSPALKQKLVDVLEK